METLKRSRQSHRRPSAVRALSGLEPYPIDVKYCTVCHSDESHMNGTS
jgi:D-arabinose 1-dehydrogenase-like Zn-dependent alcohol dehydrogenase